MRRSHLIALAAAAVVLLGLFLVLQARRGAGGALPPAHDLFQRPFQLSEVAAMRFRVGAEGEDAQQLTLTKRDDRWWVEEAGPEAVPAPADPNWVNQVLESLEKLDEGGEVRANSADVHPDFQLTGDGGVHLMLLGRDGEVLHHLIVGKQSPDWSGTFLRRADSDVVVLIRTPLRQRLRLRGDDDVKLEASAWWMLKLFDVVASEVASLEVEGGETGRLVVERDEPGPREVEEAAAAGGGPPGPMPMPPLKWNVAEGPELEDAAYFVRSFANARAIKLAPPGADTGLGEGEEPTALVRALTTEGGSLVLEIGANAPDSEGARYVRRAGEEVVYVLPAYTVKSFLEPKVKEPETEEAEETEGAEE